MTYEMKIEEERELAREEGKIEMVQEMLREHQPLEFIAKISKFSQEIGAISGYSSISIVFPFSISITTIGFSSVFCD